MAGIVLSLGIDTGFKTESISKEFARIKGLKPSFNFRSDTCNCIKYKRDIDPLEMNWVESSEYVVCAVGTVLYESRILEDSVSVIQEVLEKQGFQDNLLSLIDGHFCVIIIEKRSQVCRIITDVGGAINVYMYRIGHSYYISTSLLALAAHLPVTQDIKSIMTFLRTGMFFNDTSYFNEITTLKPASVYTYLPSNTELIRNEYWQFPKEVDTAVNIKEAATQLKKVFLNIFERIPTKGTICDLTGGYDTRFIFSFLYNVVNDKKKIHSFFFGPLLSREAIIVQENCDNLGVEYNNFVLPKEWPLIFFDHVLESNNMCDGMLNAFEYAPVLWVQRKKAEKYHNSIVGLLGEIYRGEMAKQEFVFAGMNRPANLDRYIHYIDLSSSFVADIFSQSAKTKIGEIFDYILSIYNATISSLSKNTNNSLPLDVIYFSHRMRRWGGRYMTTTNQIIRPLCPFWFKEPLSVSFKLPHKLKRRAKLMRFIVADISPKVANQKTITGAPFQLLSIANAFRFIPAGIYLLKIAIRKFAEIYLHLNIMEGFTTPDYKISPWYKSALNDNRCKDLLKWENMISSKLYEKELFQDFIEKANNDRFQYFGQLGRILTVELTLRSANLVNDVQNEIGVIL